MTTFNKLKLMLIYRDELTIGEIRKLYLPITNTN